jgi:CBS domain-containing protein
MSKEVGAMARTDINLDAMLRHLGAAYYDSLHGRATRADVNRALETVEEHLREQAPQHRAQARPRQGPAARPDDGPHHRWVRRVRDVMTTSVVTVDRITKYKEIDRLLIEHRISGMPVLKMGRHVVGVISEADLIAAEDTARRAGMSAGAGRRWRLRKPRHVGLTAGAMMTSPAITIHPDATIPAAARMMTTHHVRRLPVVNPDGKLIGIVSRRDLLSVFLRPDADILADAEQVLDEVSSTDSASITVLVRNGVVTLTGTAEPPASRHEDFVALAVRLIWDVDGVVDVVNNVTGMKPAEDAGQPGEDAGPETAQSA